MTGIKMIIAAVSLSIFAATAAKAKPIRQHGDATVIGGRPDGCPFRFCGCGLRKYLGIPDKRLDLAWNWARLFPRTYAHAGAAAVRHGHVMLLERHVGGSDWLVRDYNGGKHLAWLHVRNVSGYVFVEPSRQIAGMQ